MKYEISVRPVTRYIISEWHESEDGRAAGCGSYGEYPNRDMANEMAEARGVLRRVDPANSVCVRPLAKDGTVGPRTVELNNLPERCINSIDD